MMIRIYMEPDYSDVGDRAEGGIRRCCEALYKYLPAHDFRFVKDIRKADLTVGHGTLYPTKPDAPFISHCHGMHWCEYEWPHWAHDVNRRVTNALIRAQAVTAPSRWVAGAITRGLFVEPTVIHHGVDADEWAHQFTYEGYVLWDKARADPVSDPADMQKLAARLRDVQFVTTVGQATPNVKVAGVLPLPQLKPLIQKAGVYLATARETFGIGTLEALASGVPVVGWRYGGQSEIIIEGETGFLAPFGDFAALEQCVRRALAERPRLAANALADARARWQWPDKIEQYAALYQQVYADWHRPGPRVSVLVTCHNLARFLPAALKSVQAQPFTDWECLIVDDASTDETAQVVQEFVKADARFSYHRPERNLGLSGARNFGAAKSRGRYVINLDADDALGPNALALLAGALDKDKALHIAYGNLTVANHELGEQRPNAWPVEFSWPGQMAHLNQLHYAAMLRREVLERSGGYRERCWRAEDAEFWCRATSFGFRAAKVTDEPTLIYRIRSDSKGSTEYRAYADKDGDWTAWFPWRMAGTAKEGVAWLKEHPSEMKAPHLIPFGAQGEPSGMEFWNVSHRQNPLVSVIIPVGPGHARYALDALDSLVAQDFTNWEAIVVNDTGEPLERIAGAPYARVVATSGKQGPGVARNVGLANARAPLVLFLDADDWLNPGALTAMLDAYKRGEASYIYTDYVQLASGRMDDGNQLTVTQPEYDQQSDTLLHSIVVLMARADALAVGGFDETLAGWEDFDFFVKCAVKGLCGKRLAFPAFTYRARTGTRRDSSQAQRLALLKQLQARYADYYKGVKLMGKCCGGNKEAVKAITEAQAMGQQVAKAFASRAPITMQGARTPDMKWPYTQASAPPPPDARIKMQFIGSNSGAITFFGKDGRQYRGGANPVERFAMVVGDDVPVLEKSGKWQRVPAPMPTPPEPVRPVAESAPAPVAELVTVDAAPVAELPAPQPRRAKRNRK